MKNNHFPKRACVAAMLFILCISTLSAQQLWTDPGEGNSLDLELLKPFKSDSLFGGFTNVSGAIFLTGRYALKEQIILIGELSLVHGEIMNEDYENDAETVMGNPYVGAEFHIKESPLFLETGIRIPIIPKDNDVASAVGEASDINRMEAFKAEIFPVLLAMNYKTISENKILFRARLGTSIWFNSGNYFGNSSEDAIFDYAVQTGYAGEKVHALVCFTGRYLATAPETNNANRKIHQFGTTITVPLGNIQIGAHAKLPMNEKTARIMDFVAGLNISYKFK